MSDSSVVKFPVRVQVGELLSGRYPNVMAGERPSSWDERVSGVDLVRELDGRVLKLLSDGQQPTPRKGWVLMLTSGSTDDGYRWTLYGMPR